MARKDLFAALRSPGAPAAGAEGVRPEAAPLQEAAQSPAHAPRSVPKATDSRLPVKAITNDLLSNSQREIDPGHIEDDSPRDRLTIEDEGIAELRELIRTQGQVVPILVRRIPERPDYYRIVYGRRRLAAIRGIPGLKAKALIRNLTDEQAIITQGQENNARRNPSFIEKALFAQQLAQQDYRAEVIQDALVIDAPTVSRMKAITDRLPLEVITAIGAAPGVGRRRWSELVELLKDVPEEETVSACFPSPAPEESTSVERFELAIANLAARIKSQPKPGRQAARVSISREVRLQDGRTLARLKPSRSALNLELSRKEHPAFVAWFEEEGETILGQLYESWVKKGGSA